MQVTIYTATSIDGFIAKKDGDSDWVSEVDADIFDEKVKHAGCIVLGRKTFDQYQGELYPVEGVTNIVLTNDTDKESSDNVVFVTSVEEALKVAEEKGHNNVMVVGGGLCNKAFFEKNLVDDVIVSLHPIVLGEGIGVFEGGVDMKNLELTGHQDLKDGLIQLHYKVCK